MRTIHTIRTVGFASALFFSSHTQAFETESTFSIPISGSVGIGFLKSDDLNLKSRTMTATSLEALPGYRMGKWQFGPHLDYRWQEQVTSLSDAGGTNLRGRGYLLGVGARYNFDNRSFIQGAIDFIGKYDLLKDTSANEDDDLKSPLGFRVKAGYAFLPKIPNLTFDADIQYLTYNKIHIAGVDHSYTFNQLMASVGMTYHFDFGKRITPTISDQPRAKEPLSSRSDHLESIEGIKKVGQSLLLNISGANFDSGSADLKEEAKASLAEAAQKIAQSNASLRIEGHTDSSGKEENNKILSVARADSLKAYFVEHGVSAVRMTTLGFGSSKPIANNDSKIGRSKNRRVEIYIDAKDGE